MTPKPGSGKRYCESSPEPGPQRKSSKHSPVGTTTSVASNNQAERSSGRQDHVSPAPEPDRTTFDDPNGCPSPGADGDFASVNPHEWHPHYMACLRYFIDKSQHTQAVQSVAAFVNIRLPCQRPTNPVSKFSDITGPSKDAGSFLSLRPYIRRLIATAQDAPSIRRAFFGDTWSVGVGCIFKQQRVNYLFTAKSSGWATTKAAYDILPDEYAPFLRVLRDPGEDEIREAEGRWSEWLAMEDWMVGPRSPW